ncbi:helix-turn-helix domain-containing protein [Rhodococcus daqingensis]|uniref:Helix-turn-helix domain-containing protein n=1 Tax=Rhodococcus daqingensis TaxID=2479363 RepID=A0ABW2RTJ8_9NOCA
MSELEAGWPASSDAAKDLFRSVARTLLPQTESILDDLAAAQYQTTADPGFSPDSPLAEVDRRLTRANLEHWLAANIDTPGRPVPAADVEEFALYARDLVMRGIFVNQISAWRAAQRVSWSWWVNACFRAGADPQVLRELIDLSATSLTAFIDDSMARLDEHIKATREDLSAATQLRRQSTVQLLLEGAPIPRDRAESQLGYVLTGSHLAAIVWVDSVDAASQATQAAEQIARATHAPDRLSIGAGLTTVWLWMPTSTAVVASQISPVLASTPAARVAFGRPAADVLGFRRSHLDAASAKRLVERLGSRRRVVCFQDVHLASLISADPAEAELFISDTLGDFADADQILRDTVRTFVRERFNRSRTSERMFAHRNTIDRRLVRADELLPTPLHDNATAIDAALSLIELRDD